MTKLLEQAIAKIRELPEDEQNAIAQLVLDEVESERLWDERFSKPSKELREAADKAWGEHETGKSEPLDPDNL